MTGYIILKSNKKNGLDSINEVAKRNLEVLFHCQNTGTRYRIRRVKFVSNQTTYKTAVVHPVTNLLDRLISYLPSFNTLKNLFIKNMEAFANTNEGKDFLKENFIKCKDLPYSILDNELWDVAVAKGMGECYICEDENKLDSKIMIHGINGDMCHVLVHFNCFQDWKKNIKRTDYEETCAVCCKKIKSKLLLSRHDTIMFYIEKLKENEEALKKQKENKL